MNIFLFSLVIMLGLSIKYNIILSLIILSFIIIELKRNYKELFMLYNETKHYLPSNTSLYIPTKSTYKKEQNIIINGYKDINDLFNIYNPISINIANNLVYLSSYIFDSNSRLINIFNYNTKKWTKIEMGNNYQKDSIQLLKNDNTRYGTKTYTLNSLMFYIGGYDYYNKEIKLSNLITIYDIDWNIWYNKKIDKPVINSCIIECKNKVFFAGGFNGKSNILGYSDRVIIYDYNLGHYSKDSSWSSDILPSGGRCNINVGKVNDKVLFVGGFNINGISSDIDIYNINYNGYKWTKIKLPSILKTINININSYNDNCILTKSLNYPYCNLLDKNLVINYNNGKIIKIIDNEISVSKISGEGKHSYYGYINKISEDIQTVYSQFLDISDTDYTIEMWFNLEDYEDKTWLLKGHSHKLIPNLIIYNDRIYPIINLDGKLFIYTNGLPIYKNKWVSLTFIFDLNGICNLYYNLDTKISFKFSPVLNYDNMLRGSKIDNIGVEIQPIDTTIWVNGYMGIIKFYNRILNFIHIHNNYMTLLDRFDNSNKNIVSKMFKYNGKSNSLIALNNKISNTKYFNLHSINYKNKYLIYIGNIIVNKTFTTLTEINLLYNIEKDVWTQSIKNKHHTYINITQLNDSICLLGIKPDLKLFLDTYYLKIENKKVTKLEKKKFKIPLLCSFGQKIEDKKCIDCPEDTYSDVINSRLCLPCPIGKTTNKLNKQSQCSFPTNFFNKEREISINLEQKNNIINQKNKYQKQLSYLKDQNMKLKNFKKLL